MNFDENKHPRSSNGEFSSTPQKVAKVKGATTKPFRSSGDIAIEKSKKNPLTKEQRTLNAANKSLKRAKETEKIIQQHNKIEDKKAMKKILQDHADRQDKSNPVVKYPKKPVKVGYVAPPKEKPQVKLSLQMRQALAHQRLAQFNNDNVKAAKKHK